MTSPAPPAGIQSETFALAKRLIACRSITPEAGGSLDLVSERLSAAGFTCERLDRGVVSNLWARFGSTPPVVCLAGHVDVVPPGPLDQWASDPFTPSEHDGYLYGRGSSDMKAPLAAMITAAERVAASRPAKGSITVLLTSDEEGAAIDGTAFVIELLRTRGETIDACIIGEPTSETRLGDTIKNGRRGSLGGDLHVKGIQCHIAYPERGRNPIHLATPALAELVGMEWDRGDEHFQPTSFQISNVHTGTGAPNVIPGGLDVSFNFRFSPQSPVDTLQSRVRQVLDRHGLDYELAWTLSGLPFITPRGGLVDALKSAIMEVTGISPALSTGGGTSDGRFIARLAREVAEFGPSNESIHKINERVKIADIGPLSIIYERAIRALL